MVINMIGEKLSPVLVEIETAIWENEAVTQQPPQYTEEAFTAAIKIFMSVLMDKMWQLQEAEAIPFATGEAMAHRAGSELRQLCRVYTGIDTHELYK
jgi:hypothetical protein